MKKIIVFLLAFFSINSSAKIDEVSKMNLFNTQNIEHLKLGVGIIIGGFALRGLLNAPHYIKHIEVESENKRNDINAQFAENAASSAFAPGSTNYKALDNRRNRLLNQINRNEKFVKAFWYTAPTVGLLGSFGAFAYWFKS